MDNLSFKFDKLIIIVMIIDNNMNINIYMIVDPIMFNYVIHRCTCTHTPSVSHDPELQLTVFLSIEHGENLRAA